MSGTIYLVDKDGGGVGSLQGVNGAAIVTTATGSGIPSDREIATPSTIKTATWAVAEDITRVVITAHGPTDDSCVVCFDAPDSATATTWLAGNIDDADGATMRRIVSVGTPREFIFANPLRRIDVIDLDADVCTRVFIEAGK